MVITRPTGDAGTTLVECLVAASIVGIAFTAILGGIRTSALASDVNRKQAAAATHLRSYAEAVKRDPYAACAATYAGSGFTLPAGFSKDPVVVAYWSTATSTFASTCGSDSGLQRLTLGVRSSDGRVVQSLQIGKRAQ